MLYLMYHTYVTNVWPVTSVCSQNAMQHIMIWPALMTKKEMMKTMEIKCLSLIYLDTITCLQCYRG